MKSFWALIFFTLIIAPEINSSNILVLLPIASKSHKNVFDPLIEALASKGHAITVISSLRTAKQSSIKEIVPVPMEEIMGVMDNGFEIRKLGMMGFINLFRNTTNMERICHIMYQHEDVKPILKKDSKFDLVIMNGLANTCALGIVGHLGVPLIYVTTLPAPSSIVEKLGNYFPTSFVPSLMLPYTDRMSFFERLINLIVDTLIKRLGGLDSEETMENIYREYLPNAPSVQEIEKTQLSMIFMNSHFSMTYPRPLLPSVIEVGGMHTRQSEPLPKELDDFLSGAENGFILFSLGSIVKAKTMPEGTRKVFLNVFSRLKQRVIWKWETETMPDLPTNVKLSKWLPQQDILGHKNIRLFMTHGGLLSTQEAIYHGVPLIGIPIFFDQDLNMKQAENFGTCLSLEILDITEEKLESLIRRVLDEPKFHERAKALSVIYRHKPQTSLEKAVYWAEYVLRHNGAPHLQSSAKDLNFWQYHSLDVIAFLLSIILISLWLVKLILCKIIQLICKCFGQSTKEKTKKSSKKHQMKKTN